MSQSCNKDWNVKTGTVKSVSHQFVIAEGQIQSQDSPRSICGSRNGKVTSFSCNTVVFHYKLSLHQCTMFKLITGSAII